MHRFTALTVALTGFATGIMLVVELFARQWVDVIVGGFSADGQALTLAFLQVMALAMPASVLLNCLAAPEISTGRSRLTSIRSAVLNLSVITGIVLLALTGELDALAWSFAAAFNGAGGSGRSTPWRRTGCCRLRGCGYRMSAPRRPSSCGACGRCWCSPWRSRARSGSSGCSASGLVVGTLASLDYARTLTDSAILLVSQPVGLAVLSAGPRPDAGSQMEALARPVLAVALPASLFMVLFAPDVVQLVFARGAFNAHAVTLTSDGLRGISAGLWAATLGWILVRMLNSSGRNALAAVILALAYAANAAADIITVPWLGSLGLG